MSSAERARALAAKFSPPGEAQAEKPAIPPGVATRPTARTKRVRRTVDLPVARHHALKEWCQTTAVQLGVADVSGQDVLNALVARLLTDETLARKIRADLEEQLTQQ